MTHTLLRAATTFAKLFRPDPAKVALLYDDDRAEPCNACGGRPCNRCDDAGWGA